ncbi:hypothetical protein NL676_017814 [Syzygium grande]|nr:hypothetical protein NL676_017814 [Syzygium grande]
MSLVVATVLSLYPLPVGLRFRPTDQELVDHYLRQKINGKDVEVGVINNIDVNKRSPGTGTGSVNFSLQWTVSLVSCSSRVYWGCR